ncbi:helix-turn-helix transcriptional regulator [Streptomyces sp. ODS05-4]|uniref:helix-turn-helix domain-containing protein n=1 Tax=Streptomyces sp. ODS05-4 TaxID=2944939 RepID=UPI00210AA30D|nr:helix-turn-helix transcriptional regulator [Streptomyces sp. ODS05-4]
MPNTTEAAGEFPAALREALSRRGLSLERVSERLKARGITISQATLSHWQRGRSQPERARSLHAVDALEEILDLPGGALRSLLGPRRPRGRVSPVRGEDAARRVFGEGSVAEQLIGAEDFHDFNRSLTPLVIHDTVTVGESGRLGSLAATVVLRAGSSGVDRVRFVLGFDDEEAEPLDVRVTCGQLHEATHVPRLNAMALDIRFGRPLARMETAVVGYAVEVSPSRAPAAHYERRTSNGLHDYLQHVFFHPGALPSRCRRYVREQIGSPKRDQQPVVLDRSHSAHVFVSRCGPGVYGMAWEPGV